MHTSVSSSFEITSCPPCEVDPGRAQSREDRLSNLRTARETMLRRLREAEQEVAEIRRDAAAKRKALILDMIAVADEFDSALQTFRGVSKLRRQRQACACIEQLLDAVCHALERADVYRVDIMGKRYNDVEFKGVPIPQPWEVVGSEQRSPVAPKDLTACRVLRSLWVEHRDSSVLVLRRGQVYY